MRMKKPYFLGNWKMNLLRAEAKALARAVAAHPARAHAVTALFPAAPHLDSVAEALTGSNVAWGGQDCSANAADGAYTGDISARMLKDVGCSYVILGHSERRTLHGETDALVRQKAQAAIAAGLIPVVCVGESLAQRESGSHIKVIEDQVKGSLPKPLAGAVIVAYEPVWAIGSGKTPAMEQIAEVHKTIASMLSYATSGARMPILYGGSVKAASAAEILRTEGVDGVLVGGASLKAQEFCAIIDSATA